MSIAKLMGAGSATNVRQLTDAYATPRWVTQDFLEAERDFWPIGLGVNEAIWEPCVGLGDISKVLRSEGYKTIDTDILTGTDFLKVKERLSSAIITNPPFRVATEFIVHAAWLGVRYHAWLLKADFLNAQRALRLIDVCGYPARIWGLTSRPDFLGQGAPTMNCSWYVWDGNERAASEFRLLA